MNNLPFHLLSAGLRESDPLCRYVTIERGALDLVLVESAERTSQLAIACELLGRARAELVRAWGTEICELQPSQEAALQSIDECLASSREPSKCTGTRYGANSLLSCAIC